MKNTELHTLDKDIRFSDTTIWACQRDFYESEGISAWANQVPFYITSNPFIALTYAKIALGFIRDWISKHPETKQHPFYLLELGTGSGRFSYLFVKTLLELIESLQLTEIKFCYVMSDFTRNNLEYWEGHVALKPYIEAGLVDFAIYDMGCDAPISLERKGICLTPEILINPITVVANYIFDTIVQDAFTLDKAILHELLYTLETDEDNIKNNKPVDMKKIQISNTMREIKSDYYNDPQLDAILEDYKKTLPTTNFLIPIGAIRVIQYVKKISNDRFFILSADKGYTDIDEFNGLGNPSTVFHVNCFSMMVNFHAISEYVKNCGGDSYVQSTRKSIQSAVFVSGCAFNDLPETRTAITDCLERISISEYWQLHDLISANFKNYDLDTLLAHMEFSQWDPCLYSIISDRIVALLKDAKPRHIKAITRNIPRLVSNYYYMPKSSCVLFDIGVFYHAIKDYELALDYFQQAENYTGPFFELIYYRGRCQEALGHKELAQVTFKEAMGYFRYSKRSEDELVT